MAATVAPETAIDDNASVSALEAGLEGVFAPAPKLQPQAAAPKVDPLPDTPEGDAALADETLGEDPAAEQQEEADTGSEPEFEIEVEGVREVVRGEAQIKDMLQKAVHYSRGSEENARVREALIAQAQSQQLAQQFQQAVAGDINEFQTLRGQLAQFDGIDWSQAFDNDHFAAVKLKAQRDDLRERVQAKAGEISSKQQQFQQGQAYAAQQTLVAESQALTAKLPEWRNSERAQQGKRSIATMLVKAGFHPAEFNNLMDHRLVLVAEKAARWDELQASKGERLKQVRTAPPVNKPGTAATQQDSKSEFNKFREVNRKLGQAGKSNAQEKLMERALGRVFK